jgi:Domain of unknown function (DUF3482)/50S ribosome-binding GTPase
MSPAPLVVVLGRPNVGKSSVVAALAAAGDVEVDARPFTTTEPREVGVEAGGRVHLRLLDTPGLQEASRALQVAREHLSTDPADPAQGLSAFLARFATGEEFREEVLALSPLASGGWFVLVVDGSRPFRPNAEAEMALLRWIGRPGLAVVNRTTSTGPDHSSEWEAALRRYFPAVRSFGSHRASTEERLDLIEALGLLHPDLADAARSFREAIGEQRRLRRHDAALAVARMLLENLTYADEIAAEDEKSLDAMREALEARFHEALRDRERQSRAAIERLYGFKPGEFHSEEIERPTYQQDLFAENVWKELGLSPHQLVMLGAAGGAATGAMADVAVGGHSLGGAAAIGGILGGSAAAIRLARPRIRAHEGGVMGTGKRLWEKLSGDPRAPRFVIGPHIGENFPWILLDRALLHFESVVRRSHATRGSVRVEGGSPRQHAALALARERQRDFNRTFQDIRKAHQDPPPATQERLASLIEPVLTFLDEGPAGSPAQDVATRVDTAPPR